jgi:hypothetical protein
MGERCFKSQPLFSRGKIHQYTLKKTPGEAHSRPRFCGEKASCYGGESIYNFAVILSAAASLSRTYGYKFCISLHSLCRMREFLRRSDATRASKEQCNKSFTSAAQYPIFLNIHHCNNQHDERLGYHGGESYSVSSSKSANIAEGFAAAFSRVQLPVLILPVRCSTHQAEQPTIHDTYWLIRVKYWVICHFSTRRCRCIKCYYVLPLEDRD